MTMTSKVDMPALETNLKLTPTFEWHAIRCGSENGLKKDMCLKEIGLREQKYDNHFGLKCQHDWRGGGRGI